MRLKDHYKTLLLTPVASQQEIRKSFRQLALKYHPDKNGGSKYAEAHFREIQEAYQILSDPVKRLAYNQQRWYSQNISAKKTAEPPHPDLIMYKCSKLSQYVAALDASGLNTHALYHYIMYLLSQATVTMLLEHHDTDTNNRIIIALLRASKPLPFKNIEPIAERLIRLSGNDQNMIAAIRSFVKEKRLSGYWHTYQFMIILVITLLICWLIASIST